MKTNADLGQVGVAEFFAGIGLMAAGLECKGFEVQWANDIESGKRDLYVANRSLSAHRFKLKDVRRVKGRELPKTVELATASFPCIDLSLAGNRKGLAGTQSGMFWEFARVLEEMDDDRPMMVLLENVYGFATSHGGRDLSSALARMNNLGYSCDVFAINASHFVPQSRPRMFVVGIRGPLPPSACGELPPITSARPAWVRAVYESNVKLRMHFVDLPKLPAGPSTLTGVVEALGPTDRRWWDESRTRAFVQSLSERQSHRLAEMRASDSVVWRTTYRRTRKGVATWEIRADKIAGCLRTTGGGSSRQAIVQAGQGQVALRWMTPLEYARLMGAASYETGVRSENQALFGFGDAIVVDVVGWIADNYLIPTIHAFRELAA